MNSFKGDTPNSMLATNRNPSTGLYTLYGPKILDAYYNRRIFAVFGKNRIVRRALLRRGWLEKLDPGVYPELEILSEDVLLKHAKEGNEYEAVAISKILKDFPAFFIWQHKHQQDLWAEVSPHRNRVRRGRSLDFSTKIGLIGCAEQEQWYIQENVCGMKYPRFHRLCGNYAERRSFIEDFLRTLCSSLLRYITENINQPEELIDEENGTMTAESVCFALFYVKKHLNELEHNTLDDVVVRPNICSEPIDWHSFMTNCDKILQKRTKLKLGLRDLSELEVTARDVVTKLEEKCIDRKWDGCRNLWILKPSNQSRGNGIIISSSLEQIIRSVSTNLKKKYIVQKYVERPLLIYSTKFDIRQYMLLSVGESTVSIWLYNDCYFRFSSQEYNTDDLRESIHLTNNYVQKNYNIHPNRDVRLPQNNMWSLEQFKRFLKYKIPDATGCIWDNKIYPGFKENLIAVVLASFAETEFIPNSFELYGCDFMMDEQYTPILIEINSSPDLSASTEVTARICPMVIKDLMKVVVDLPRNSKTKTGLFELVYEVNYKIKSDFDPQIGLSVNGTAMMPYHVRHSYKGNRLRKPASIAKTVEKTTTKYTTSKKLRRFFIPMMEYRVSPAVRFVIEPKIPNGLPKLIERRKRKIESESMVQYTIEESGKNVTAGARELNLIPCTKTLEEDST